MWSTDGPASVSQGAAGGKVAGTQERRELAPLAAGGDLPFALVIGHVALRSGLRDGTVFRMADSLFARAGRMAGAAARPVAGAASLGVRLERRTRTAAIAGLTEAALAGLDALLVSRLAAESVERLLASALARNAVSNALEGPIVEAVTQDVIRHAVLERVAGELTESDAVGTLTEVVLADGAIEQAAARVLEGPELERVVTSALDSAAMERLVARVIDSRLLDQAVERLLESKELWVLVDEVAHSPAVTDAIAQQSIGFADQVAGGVRTRSQSADTWIETRVRRALGRRPAPPARPPESP